MNRIRIKELERSLGRVREVLISMSDEELTAVSTALQNAGFATALESYSREAERQRNQEPALV